MGEAMFLYDGDCAFCSSCARFLQRRVPTRAGIEAWQFVELGPLGLTVEQCDEAVQWVAGATSLSGPAAIAALLRTSSWPWRVVGWVLGTRPVLWLAGPIYRWVARNRHRMPGGSATCSLPAAQRRAAGEHPA